MSHPICDQLVFRALADDGSTRQVFVRADAIVVVEEPEDGGNGLVHAVVTVQGREPLRVTNAIGDVLRALGWSDDA